MTKIEFPNDKILGLWQKYFGKENDRVYAPLFYPHFRKGGVLFVGLNPSFSSRGFRKLLKDSPYENIKPEEYFKFTNMIKRKVNTIIEVEKLAMERYDYFTKLKMMAGDLGIFWQHIDLFFERKTDQKSIKSEYIKKDNSLSDFAKEQFGISFETIKFINPKIIVVINALASDILKRELAQKICFYENMGTYRLKLNKLQPIIFFSGMLSGQRALDNHSFERLRWHMRFVMKKKLKK